MPYFYFLTPRQFQNSSSSLDWHSSALDPPHLENHDHHPPSPPLLLDVPASLASSRFERPSSDDVDSEGAAGVAFISLSMRIPSFVAVVLMPYTPTAANPHHHIHRIATFDVSIARCFTRDISGIDGILLEIAAPAQETTDAFDGIGGILREIPSLARTRMAFDVERIESRIRPTWPLTTAPLARSPPSIVPVLAAPSIALLAKTLALVARCPASSVAFSAADFSPFAAPPSDAQEAARGAPPPLATDAAAERRESRSSHLEFDEKDLRLQ
jgi:hypothetical protein